MTTRLASHLWTLPECPHEENKLVELQHAVAVEVHLSQLVLDVRTACRDVELRYQMAAAVWAAQDEEK